MQIGTPTYDDHGNTTSLAGNGTPIQFTYDANDQNTKIEQGTNRVEYLKSATGSVLRKKEYQSGTLTKSYRYLSGGSVLQQCSLTDDNDCTTLDTYISLPGNTTLTLSPTNPDTANRTVYSLKNLHSDTSVTTNNQGNPTSSIYMYEPFGQNTQSQTFGTSSNPTNATDQSMGWAANPTRKQESPQLFTIPIIQMGARTYIPILGRFIQVDPVEGGTANAYAYVGDPVGDNDYSGQWSIRGVVKSVLKAVQKAAVRVAYSQSYGSAQSSRAIAVSSSQPQTTPTQKPSDFVKNMVSGGLKDGRYESRMSGESVGKALYRAGSYSWDYFSSGSTIGIGMGCVAGAAFFVTPFGCIPGSFVGEAIGGPVFAVWGFIDGFNGVEPKFEGWPDTKNPFK